MGDFSAEWLALREPADVAARSGPLTDRIVARLQERKPLRVLDLATGTGSNIRFLAPRLPSPQEWSVVDRDRELLAEIPRRMGAWGIAAGHLIAGNRDAFTLRSEALTCRVRLHAADLSRIGSTDPVLSTLFGGVDLVTASALLDLVSERWLVGLAERCRASGAAVLFVLSYDGRLTCTPGEPEDEEIRQLVNRHQRTSKGFGRALGPDAAACAVRHFAAAGYDTHLAPSDWQIAASQPDLQRQLLEGWAAAATEIAPDRTAAIASWLGRRLAHVQSGRSTIVVGHQDVAGWPGTGG